jgi:hypothetical protein
VQFIWQRVKPCPSEGVAKSACAFKILIKIKHPELTMSSTRKLPSPDDPQFDLFGGVPASSAEPVLQTAVHSGRRFVTGDANACGIDLRGLQIAYELHQGHTGKAYQTLSRG